MNLALGTVGKMRGLLFQVTNPLAKLICDCAPNSLGDSSNPEEPEVIVHNYMDITIYD